MLFIDSHIHSTYSILDGLITIDEYIEFAKKNRHNYNKYKDSEGLILKCQK